MEKEQNEKKTLNQVKKQKPLSLDQIKQINNTIGMRDALIESLEYAESEITKLKKELIELKTKKI
jgi:hypothetical protein